MSTSTDREGRKKQSRSERLDDLGRRHPWLTLVTTLVATTVATLMLLLQSEGTVVLYQAF